ncbi:recombinase family protein [Flavobacterium oreochromis]|uniref:recombinase family protein n=1 Tax=Flavobacterium oreochromis TaxID=2906078 RepID=UPI00386ADF40
MGKKKTYSTAVGYLRVSSLEQQSQGTSLESQKESIKNFCISKGIVLLNIFIETYSGKDFERPEFNKAYNFLVENKGEVDLFLTMKVDRFTRDTYSGLATIDKINKIGVEVNYVDDWVEDNDSPQSRMITTIKMSFAEFERRTIIERTRLGERTAMKAGRYIKTPPSGYSRAVLSNGKKGIKPNGKAKLVKNLFEDYSTGIYSQDELLKKYTLKGLSLSKSSISRTLENILYTGYIDLKKHNIPPYNLVKGLHEPIISEELFNKVQDVKNGKNNKLQKIRPKNPEFPLNTFLYCSNCGNPMRGSASNNGKNKTRKYLFYRCANNCGEAYKPELVHSVFNKTISEIKPSAGVIELFKTILIDEYENYTNQRMITYNSIESKIEDFKKQQMTLTDKYINGKIDDEIYDSFIQKLKQEIYHLQTEKENYESINSDLNKFISFGLTFVTNIDLFYKNASIEIKTKLLGSYFNDKLYFSKNKFRTLPFNEAILLITKFNKGLEGLKKEKGELFSKFSRSVPGVGIEPTLRRTRV